MVSLIIWLLSAGNACAQGYPSRPIRIVTGAPGSTAEFAARMLSQQKQQFGRAGKLRSSAEPAMTTVEGHLELFDRRVESGRVSHL